MKTQPWTKQKKIAGKPQQIVQSGQLGLKRKRNRKHLRLEAQSRGLESMHRKT
ncbi:hypothetical protein DPMN_185224 [Dreissena polymorpha]|uniref:Uncharacterized protein n=1 Tax=Dreissena polymorpha TaxID=45954 RepID=A0A9D4DN74_DREPO|nr:hypothetical protein DPMN_185224 [Dreissena polymorpha]